MLSDGLDELVIEVFNRAAMYEYRCICGRLRHKYMQDAERIIEDNDQLIRREIGITLYRERWDYPITSKEATERRKETLKRIVEAIERGKNENHDTGTTEHLHGLRYCNKGKSVNKEAAHGSNGIHGSHGKKRD